MEKPMVKRHNGTLHHMNARFLLFYPICYNSNISAHCFLKSWSELLLHASNVSQTPIFTLAVRLQTLPLQTKPQICNFSPNITHPNLNWTLNLELWNQLMTSPLNLQLPTSTSFDINAFKAHSWTHLEAQIANEDPRRGMYVCPDTKGGALSLSSREQIQRIGS